MTITFYKQKIKRQSKRVAGRWRRYIVYCKEMKTLWKVFSRASSQMNTLPSAVFHIEIKTGS